MRHSEGHRGRAVARDRSVLLHALWLVTALVSLGVLIADRWLTLPDRVGPGGAGALATTLAVGLAIRAGGRPLVPGLLAAGFAAVTVATMWPVLLGGAAAGTAAIAATLALMATVPAPTFWRAAGEVLVASVVATLGGLGVAGFGAELDEVRLGYVVLAVTLGAAFVLVYRLGAGFHGLGRRGYVVAGGALVLLALALAYSEALGHWGSPELIGHLDQVRDWTREHLHAVPHPIEALLGVPALCWGVFVRARRRQGWWVCAFGAALTAPATSRFVITEGSTSAAVLAAVYSIVVGLLIGYALIRIDQSFTGSRGRRARRTEEAAAHRPEPGRLDPLH